MMLTYDETEIVTRLAKLDATQKGAFAASCTERLMPLLEGHAARKDFRDWEALRKIVDAVWNAVEGAPIVLEPLQELAEDLVPDEDADWCEITAYQQNAAACAAYAVRVLLSDDSAEGGWAARQVYEAADFAAQQAIGEAAFESAAREHALLSHDIVQAALAGIRADLDLVEQQQHGFETLAQRAVAEGHAWAEGIRKLNVTEGRSPLVSE